MEPITTLGQVLKTEEYRDAIHVAIAPVVAAEKLLPGEHVGLDDRGQATAGAQPVGVVDPFLTVKSIRKGERFWLMLYPNTITSLRHQWAHPSFGPLDASKISHDDHVTKSKAWISQHASDMGLSEDVLMQNAADWLADTSEWPDVNVQHGSERWRDTFNATEFWHHYEIVTGTIVPQNRKDSSPYCCSC